MYPELPLFGASIPTYLLCCGIGLVAALWVLCGLLLNERLLREQLSLYLLSLIGLLTGARLLGILSRLLDIYQETGAWDPGESLHSGIVYLGGLLGYLLTLYLLCRLRHLPPERILDRAAVIIPLFHACGRIGCYLGGCCYGCVSQSWLALPYRLVLEDGLWERRIPVQLMEAGFEAVLFVMFYFCYTHPKKSPALLKNGFLKAYLFLYSVWRFVIEFYRGDAVRGVFGAVSFSQVICVGILLYLVCNDLIRSWRKCDA